MPFPGVGAMAFPGTCGGGRAPDRVFLMPSRTNRGPGLRQLGWESGLDAKRLAPLSRLPRCGALRRPAATPVALLRATSGPRP